MSSLQKARISGKLPEGKDKANMFLEWALYINVEVEIGPV